MKRLLLLTLFLALAGAGCDSLDVDTSKDVDSDPISDITLFNNQFHTVNIDTSGNAGSQIDLIQLSDAGERLANIPLEMNGHGYMAITDDEERFYLLSRRYEILFTVSPDGEQINGQWANLEEVWQPVAVTYVEDEDKLLMLYRNSSNPSEYRARLVEKDNIGTHERDLVFSYDFISTGATGIYALAYNDDQFYALGINQQGEHILIETDMDFEVSSRSTIGSNQVAGLAFRGDDLYFSYFDGRVEIDN
jgi:hypothetical protein